jgi:hypothetical protein
MKTGPIALLAALLLSTTACDALTTAPDLEASELSVALSIAEGNEVGPGPGGPLANILGRKAELGLTAEQVAALEQIRAELIAKNKPLRDQIRALLPAGERPRRPDGLTEEQRAAIKPLMEQIRANERAAMAAVKSILTAEQLDRLEKRNRRMHRPGR